MFGLGPNWKPTLFAMLAAVSELLSQEGISIYHLGKTDVVRLVGSVSLLLLGFFAKDRAVTGGTISNGTPESVVRVEEGTKALSRDAVAKLEDKGKI